MNAAKLVLITLAFATGCQQKNDQLPLPTRDVPDAKDKNGWPLYEQPADGFAIALPPDWAALDRTPGSLDGALDTAIKANPEFQAIGNSMRQEFADEMKFMGMERAGPASGRGTNVNLIKTPLDGVAEFDDVVAEIVKETAAMVSVQKPVAHKPVQLNAGRSERLRYVLAVNDSDGEQMRLTTIQYLMIRGKNLYILTFVVQADKEAKYEPTFESIAQSFRFLGK